MMLTILAEPLKNSEIVTISLWLFGAIGASFLWLAKNWFDTQQRHQEGQISALIERFQSNEKAIEIGLEKVSNTLEHGFSVAFGRIDALEKFKAKIETLHTINHKQDLQ